MDPERLAQKLAETRRVAALLGDVFQEDDQDEGGPTIHGGNLWNPEAPGVDRQAVDVDLASARRDLDASHG